MRYPYTCASGYILWLASPLKTARSVATFNNTYTRIDEYYPFLPSKIITFAALKKQLS